MKLKTYQPRTASTAWYRTADGRFDVLGDDLNTNNAVGRAAGAGAVWSWRPADGDRYSRVDMHHFASKAACLADLEAHIAASAPPPQATAAPAPGVPVHRVPTANSFREPDPVDLMLAGDYVGAIAAYRAIIADSGDPLGVCAAQIAECQRRIAALTPKTVVVVSCARCQRQNRVTVGVSSRCGHCKFPIPADVVDLVVAVDAAQAAPMIVVVCAACTQKNRVRAGTTARCGKCRQLVTARARTGNALLDNLMDGLDDADNGQAFGRMHFPQDYDTCARCGATTHKTKSAPHVCALSVRKHTTRSADAAYIFARLGDLNRAWQVGDATLPYRTCNPATTIARFDGDTVHLADGSSMHRSYLKTPKGAR